MRLIMVEHTRTHGERGVDVKLIGIYDSLEAAEKAVTDVKDQMGFCDYPSGFELIYYDLAVPDGFVLKKVFVLSHEEVRYPLLCDVETTVGLFLSETDARAAINPTYSRNPERFSKGTFAIGSCPIGHTGWLEGFGF